MYVRLLLIKVKEKNNYNKCHKQDRRWFHKEKQYINQ